MKQVVCPAFGRGPGNLPAQVICPAFWRKFGPGVLRKRLTGATTVSSMDGHIWRWAGKYTVGIRTRVRTAVGPLFEMSQGNGDG